MASGEVMKRASPLPDFDLSIDPVVRYNKLL